MLLWDEDGEDGRTDGAGMRAAQSPRVPGRSGQAGAAAGRELPLSPAESLRAASPTALCAPFTGFCSTRRS